MDICTATRLEGRLSPATEAEDSGLARVCEYCSIIPHVCSELVHCQHRRVVAFVPKSVGPSGGGMSIVLNIVGCIIARFGADTSVRGMAYRRGVT